MGGYTTWRQGAGDIGAAGVTAAGDYFTQRTNEKATQKQIDAANRAAGQLYAEQEAWRTGLSANPLFQSLMGPSRSSQSGWDNSTTTFDQRSSGQMAPGFENLPAEVKNRYMEASIIPQLNLYREQAAIGNEQNVANQAAARIAGAHGVSASALGPTPADRQAAIGLADAGLNAANQTYAMQGQNIGEQARIADMLAEVFKTGTTTSSSRDQSQTVGPGNYAAALNLMAPGKRQIFA